MQPQVELLQHLLAMFLEHIIYFQALFFLHLPLPICHGQTRERSQGCRETQQISTYRSCPSQNATGLSNPNLQGQQSTNASAQRPTETLSAFMPCSSMIYFSHLSSGLTRFHHTWRLSICGGCRKDDITQTPQRTRSKIVRFSSHAASQNHTCSP